MYRSKNLYVHLLMLETVLAYLFRQCTTRPCAHTWHCSASRSRATSVTAFFLTSLKAVKFSLSSAVLKSRRSFGRAIDADAKAPAPGLQGRQARCVICVQVSHGELKQQAAQHAISGAVGYRAFSGDRQRGRCSFQALVARISNSRQFLPPGCDLLPLSQTKHAQRRSTLLFERCGVPFNCAHARLK